MKKEVNLNKVLYKIKKKLKNNKYQSITIYYKKNWYSKTRKLIYSKTLNKNVYDEFLTYNSYSKSLNNIFLNSNKLRKKQIQLKKGIIIIVKVPYNSKKELCLNVLECLKSFKVNNSKIIFLLLKLKQYHFYFNKHYNFFQAYNKMKMNIDYLKKNNINYFTAIRFDKNH